MTKKETTIQLKSGLEARPVAMLVQIASHYESSVHIETEGKLVNAKSIMGMMSLTLDVGESVCVFADGKDEEEAVNAVADYINGKEEQ